MQTVGIAVGIPSLLILGTGIGLYAYTDDKPALDLTLASGATASRGPSLLARPGFLGLAAPSGERVGITGTGIGGAF